MNKQSTSTMLGQHGRRWWVNIKQTFWSRVCQSHIFIFLVWSLCAQNWSKTHHALDNSLCWQYIYRPTWVRWTRHAIWRMSQGWLVFDKHSGRWSHIQAGWVVSRRYRGGGGGTKLTLWLPRPDGMSVFPETWQRESPAAGSDPERTAPRGKQQDVIPDQTGRC